MDVRTPEGWKFWFELQTEAVKQVIRKIVDAQLSEGKSHSNAMNIAYEMIHGTSGEIVVRKVSR